MARRPRPSAARVLLRAADGRTPGPLSGDAAPWLQLLLIGSMLHLGIRDGVRMSSAAAATVNWAQMECECMGRRRKMCRRAEKCTSGLPCAHLLSSPASWRHQSSREAEAGDVLHGKVVDAAVQVKPSPLFVKCEKRRSSLCAPRTCECERSEVCFAQMTCVGEDAGARVLEPCVCSGRAVAVEHI